MSTAPLYNAGTLRSVRRFVESSVNTLFTIGAAASRRRFSEEPPV
jgi:hypothetical protein